MKKKVQNRILDFFVTSSDFNGILLSDISAEFDIPWSNIREVIHKLVQEEKISLVFASHSINPHIKRLPDLPLDEQLEKLSNEEPNTICAYPTPHVIHAGTDLSIYDTRPFTKRLATGEAQLQPVFF
jgi:hypothetical protein